MSGCFTKCLQDSQDELEPKQTCTRPVYCRLNPDIERSFAEELVNVLDQRHSCEIISYSLSDVIPLQVSLVANVSSSDDIVRIPAQWLELIHLNEDMPWYRNVWLFDENTVKVKERYMWVPLSFNKWLHEFVQRVITVVTTLFRLSADHKAFVVGVLTERRKEVVERVRQQFSKEPISSEVTYVI